MLSRFLLFNIMIGLSFSAHSDTGNINQQMLDNSLIEANEENIKLDASIQEMLKQSQKGLIIEKIELLKKDIDKWTEYKNKLLSIKIEYEKEIHDNDIEIEILSQEVADLMAEIKYAANTIEEKSTVIETTKKELLESPEIVEYILSGGKKIKLIKYTVTANDTLNDIVIATFKDKSKINLVNVKQRANVIVSMNNNIIETQHIKVGEIIYIPFFKE